MYTAAVLTVSDRSSRGERPDGTGPVVRSLLEAAGYQVMGTDIVPDELEDIKAALTDLADRRKAALVVTAGGTGFSPRDVTPEATLEVVERAAPGIPEAMRAESLRITPKGCLSRAAAGIRGRTLIVNLPGSKKAAGENLTAVIGPIAHGVEMLLGSGSANCGEPRPSGGERVPSVDEWLREAKAGPFAEKIGMYLTHNGVVRGTARAQARGYDKMAAPVSGMVFSYDAEKVGRAVADTEKLPGIYHVRVWLNKGRLRVGDDLMLVLVGGDIRPHAADALHYLVDRLKSECVTEEELI